MGATALKNTLGKFYLAACARASPIQTRIRFSSQAKVGIVKHCLIKPAKELLVRFLLALGNERMVE